MIVDPSAVARGLISRILETDPDISVVATAHTGEAALPALKTTEVDVILLDATLPGIDALSLLPKLVEIRPDVRVLLACPLTKDGADITMKALCLGAVDYIQKPGQEASTWGAAPVSDQLVAKIRSLANLPRTSSANSSEDDTCAASNAPDSDSAVIELARRPTPSKVSVLAIGSSTGGPNALHTLLDGLGKSFPVPILVVQHMPALFTGLLAERLRSETGLDAREAVDGMLRGLGAACSAEPGASRTLLPSGRGSHVSVSREDVWQRNIGCRPHGHGRRWQVGRRRD